MINGHIKSGTILTNYILKTLIIFFLKPISYKRLSADSPKNVAGARVFPAALSLFAAWASYLAASTFDRLIVQTNNSSRRDK